MRAGTELYGIPIKASDLGQPQARLYCHEQQRVVATACPRRLVRNGEDGLDLGSAEELDFPAGDALWRDRKDTLNLHAICRFFERNETKERPDRRQTQVARSCSDAPLDLQMLEETSDQRASRSARFNRDGGRPSFFDAKRRRSRNVDRSRAGSERCQLHTVRRGTAKSRIDLRFEACRSFSGSSGN